MHLLFQNYKAMYKPENEGALDQWTQSTSCWPDLIGSFRSWNRERAPSRKADVGVNRGTNTWLPRGDVQPPSRLMLLKTLG